MANFILNVLFKVSQSIMAKTAKQQSIMTKRLQKTWKFLFWKTTSCSKDWPKNLFLSYLLFICDFLLSKDFQSSSITFVISNNSTFFGIKESKWKVTIKFDNLATISNSIETVTNFCALFLFLVVVYIIQLQLFEMELFLHIVVVVSFIF